MSYILTAVDRDELIRLQKVERLARALFYHPDATIAVHVAAALADPTNRERQVALFRACSASIGEGNDKLLDRVYELRKTVTHG